MRRAIIRFTPVLAAAALATSAAAADIRVTVSGLDSADGEVGCALHREAATFPMDPSGARSVWVTPVGRIAECRFENVAPGDYAIAVSHDLNGNRATDTNFVGLPTEDWGVSNNVRPFMRPPRFAEAVFTVTDAPVALSIEVDR
jgi:Uncharacterized protein conserved in bacteria